MTQTAETQDSAPLPDFMEWKDLHSLVGSISTRSLVAQPTTVEQCKEALAYCRERELARYARARVYPIIPCNLCGSQENLQRQAIKQMLAGWEAESPGRTDIMFRALQNISPSQLADRSLFDFEGLEGLREAVRS